MCPPSSVLLYHILRTLSERMTIPMLANSDACSPAPGLGDGQPPGGFIQILVDESQRGLPKGWEHSTPGCR